MGVWAMLLVTPSGRPAPSEAARRTAAVVDGWDSWLLPIARSREQPQPSPERRPELLFVVTGDDSDGELHVWSRRGLSLTPITPAADGDGWRFDRPEPDVIKGFVKEAGLRRVRRARVARALAATFDTPLHAVHALLQSLRLSRSRAFAAEDYLAGHALDDPELPAVFRSDQRGSGVRALAIDHGAPWWHRLVATQDLYDYGEPPCLVAAEVGGMFVASDPPVSLRYFDDTDLVGAGDWVDVPTAAAGSVTDFVGWAREHVGVAGRAVSTARRPLRGEVDDEPPASHETRFPAWPYRLAQHPTLKITLSPRASHPAFAEGATRLLDTVRQELLLPLMAAYRSAGGSAVASRHVTLGEPNQMLVSVMTSARGGADHTYAVDTDDWRRAVDDVARRGWALSCSVEVCDATGFATGLRWGTTRVVLDPGTSPAFTVTISEPLLGLLGDAAPVTAVVEHAVTDLGLSAGGTSFGRTTRRPHWLTLLDEKQLHAVGGRDHLIRSGLFDQVRTLTSPAGEITWLQATRHPSRFDATHAARLAGILFPARDGDIRASKQV
ncbi:MAG: hypothetical protein M3422_27490 [Actinomycetota bacterium]|nr:hypothetical protein [Actinomycetota bacterium]